MPIQIGPGRYNYGTEQKCCYATKPKHAWFCKNRKKVKKAKKNGKRRTATN